MPKKAITQSRGRNMFYGSQMKYVAKKQITGKQKNKKNLLVIFSINNIRATNFTTSLPVMDIVTISNQMVSCFLSFFFFKTSRKGELIDNL